LVPRRGRDFSLLRSMQNDYDDYLPSYPKGAINSCPEGKQLGMDCRVISMQWMAEVKNV